MKYLFIALLLLPFCSCTKYVEALGCPPDTTTTIVKHDTVVTKPVTFMINGVSLNAGATVKFTKDEGSWSRLHIKVYDSTNTFEIEIGFTAPIKPDYWCLGGESSVVDPKPAYYSGKDHLYTNFTLSGWIYAYDSKTISIDFSGVFWDMKHNEIKLYALLTNIKVN